MGCCVSSPCYFVDEVLPILPDREGVADRLVHMLLLIHIKTNGQHCSMVSVQCMMNYDWKSNHILLCIRQQKY